MSINTNSSSYFNETDDIIVSHSGVINEKVISEKGGLIREIFKENIYLSRKIFSIYMELIQNIYYYSSEKVELNGKAYSVGSVKVIKNKSGYVIQSCNLAEKNFVDNIQKKFPVINALNKEKLRKLKIEQRKKPQEELSKGAGIGLIQIAIISENPLKIFFQSKNNTQSYYNIHVKVDGDH